MRIVGVDPGGTTGIAILDLAGEPSFRIADMTMMQVRGYLAYDVVELCAVAKYTDVIVAAEKFVIGHRAARSSTAGAGKFARDLLGAIQQIDGITYAEHTAADVKRWATDKRLAEAGLFPPTSGMGHARDAARHALFTAVKRGLLPDPLSQKAGS